MLPDANNYILDEIETIINDYESGIENESAVNKISNLLKQIKPADNHINEKIITIERFSRILFSSKKYTKHGGKSHIKLFIISECEDLRKVLVAKSGILSNQSPKI